jgi:hypothetical protein
MMDADLARPRRHRFTISLDDRGVAGLMTFIAATLVVMSAFHLGGVLDEGSDPFDPDRAAVSEAVIALALFWGAGALRGGSPRGRAFALATVGIAIVGFTVGLNFTARGAGAFDVAYHLVGLPLLALAAFALLRRPAGA